MKGEDLRAKLVKTRVVMRKKKTVYVRIPHFDKWGSDTQNHEDFEVKDVIEESDRFYIVI